MKEIIEIPTTTGQKSKIMVGDFTALLPDLTHGRRTVVITDYNIHRIYGDLLAGYRTILVGSGETIKTQETAGKIYRELLDMGVDRGCLILGFGGGIVTDIAGFVASTYMRGVSFGFVSTTLLGQVDASVGGKNGVNLDGYKNMIGTFHQPEFVVSDPRFLGTLPEREFKSGIAEMIKAGIISDPVLFEYFENNPPVTTSALNVGFYDAIRRSILVKVDIVSCDEKESGERRKLNLGHTFAHAIEKFSRNFTHGEAVSIGLAASAEISVRAGLMGEDDCLRIKDVLVKWGLPVDPGIDPAKFLTEMALDKKKEADVINLVLPESIGKCIIRKVKLSELSDLVCGKGKSL